MEHVSRFQCQSCGNIFEDDRRYNGHRCELCGGNSRDIGRLPAVDATPTGKSLLHFYCYEKPCAECAAVGVKGNAEKEAESNARHLRTNDCQHDESSVVDCGRSYETRRCLGCGHKWTNPIFPMSDGVRALRSISQHSGFLDKF
jgi:hypothetical protein